MGQRRLKAAMPRAYADHRTTAAKRLRVVYDDLGARFGLAETDGVCRRVALLIARAWIAYEDVTRDLEAPHKGLAIRRLQRRQRAALGQFTAGLRDLEELCTRRPNSVGNLMDALKQQRPAV
jgi:hypothetical protein